MRAAGSHARRHHDEPTGRFDVDRQLGPQVAAFFSAVSVVQMGPAARRADLERGVTEVLLDRLPDSVIGAVDIDDEDARGSPGDDAYAGPWPPSSPGLDRRQHRSAHLGEPADLRGIDSGAAERDR